MVNIKHSTENGTMKPKPGEDINISYHRAGFESKAGHRVRSTMESVVCEWLMTHGVAHRHGSEVFTVRIGVAGTPTAYVPDIITHDKDSSGRTIIIEAFDAYSPKMGNTRIVAQFRKEMMKDYYIIVVAKKQQMTKVLSEAYDVMIDYDDLDDLETKLPIPPR